MWLKFYLRETSAGNPFFAAVCIPCAALGGLPGLLGGDIARW